MNAKADVSDTQVMTMADLFPTGQILLSELSVYNWGSFNGLHTARIDPQGTLVTGDNGAGKSTLIDGLMALMLPAGRAMFNVAAAQGDRSDRSLISYMRGSYGSTHEAIKSKREGGVVSGLRALYRAEDGSVIALAALFWTTQATNALSDIKRVYIVSTRDLSLKEVLHAFEGGNVRAMKQWLRDDSSIKCFDENFSEYQAYYRKLLWMENKNAPDLLSRALGLKKIDDLTQLIRELVLEPSTVRDDARSVVDEFANLVAIHDQLVDARAQRDCLERLPELDEKIKELGEKLRDLTEERDGLSVFMAEIRHGLHKREVDACKQALAELKLSIEQAKLEETEKDAQVERYHEDYLNCGGNRIEAVKGELKHVEDALERTVRAASSYQANARTLGLDETLEKAQFVQNRSAVESALVGIDSEVKGAEEAFVGCGTAFSELQKQEKSLREEIADIERRPDSNVDSRYQQFRDSLCEALSLDRNALVFMAELMDVADDQRDWQGAIERALGGLRTTLLVPKDDASLVTSWVNARHMGLHVRVRAVGSSVPSGQAAFKSDGFLKKLVWRQHPYRDWLKHHLAGHDLTCVDTPEAMNATPYSMTVQGTVNLGSGSYEKKDQNRVDDRRNWYLGFSNKARLSILSHDLSTTKEAIAQATKAVAEARDNLDAVKDRKRLMNEFMQYEWSQIDASFQRDKRDRLRDDLKALESDEGDLKAAQTRWESAKEEAAKIRSKLVDLSREQGVLEDKLQSSESERKKAYQDAEGGLVDTVRARLERRVSASGVDTVEAADTLFTEQYKAIEKSLDSCRGDKGVAERHAVGIMNKFNGNEKWGVLSVEWGSDLAGMDEYIRHYHHLEDDGLPHLVDEFKERLNKHATQSLARIQHRLDGEREDIAERIDTINMVLRRTEFGPGSYLKLGSKPEQYDHVLDFRKRVTKVLSQATSDDHEGRFKALEEVVGILDKASSPATANTKESLRLLDPRYQMSFYAEEIDASDNKTVLDVMGSSSGKSGGEKESFAGTIVAASLAYVLTPDGCDRPVYSTVFLDEAFSNTAEAVSRRVLRVFKEMHIHVNLITPYKNLNLARDSARSLLIAERDKKMHESHLCEVTWEEIDRRLAEQRQNELRHQATELGLEIESAS
ncbi:MAG: hypothetical protein J5I92_10890 [Thiogranum sp.]|nr:hypothetical protein [Thiogranum sp.]